MNCIIGQSREVKLNKLSFSYNKERQYLQGFGNNGSPAGPGIVATFQLIKYRTPEPTKEIAPRTAKVINDFSQEARNLTGDIKHNKATQIVRVKNIDTAVLIARI